MNTKILPLIVIFTVPIISANEDLLCTNTNYYTICKENNVLVSVNRTTDSIFLNINAAEITTVGPNAFHDNEITYLNLNFNRSLVELHQESFQGLQKVNVLRIGSAIMRMESQLFKALPALETIIIANCEILEFKRGAFAGLADTINTIDIQESMITVINVNTFADASDKLKHLYIPYNNVSVIEPMSFAAFTNLLYLDLHYNELTDLQTGTFQGLNNLKRLLLRGNQLTTIRKNVFKSFASNFSLDLSFNRINYIEPEAFADLDLFMLNLNSNQLTSISGTTFAGASRIDHLALYNNNIVTAAPNSLKDLEIQKIYIDTSIVTIDKEIVGLSESSVVVNTTCKLYDTFTVLFL